MGTPEAFAFTDESRRLPLNPERIDDALMSAQGLLRSWYISKINTSPFGHNASPSGPNRQAGLLIDAGEALEHIILEAPKMDLGVVLVTGETEIPAFKVKHLYDSNPAEHINLPAGQTLEINNAYVSDFNEHEDRAEPAFAYSGGYHYLGNLETHAPIPSIARTLCEKGKLFLVPLEESAA